MAANQSISQPAKLVTRKSIVKIQALHEWLWDIWKARTTLFDSKVTMGRCRHEQVDAPLQWGFHAPAENFATHAEKLVASFLVSSSCGQLNQTIEVKKEPPILRD